MKLSYNIFENLTFKYNKSILFLNNIQRFSFSIQSFNMFNLIKISVNNVELFVLLLGCVGYAISLSCLECMVSIKGGGRWQSTLNFKLQFQLLKILNICMRVGYFSRGDIFYGGQLHSPKKLDLKPSLDEPIRSR